MATPEQEGSAAGSPQTTPVPEEMDFDLFGQETQVAGRRRACETQVAGRRRACEAQVAGRRRACETQVAGAGGHVKPRWRAQEGL